MLERLHKVLARAGVAALRPAEDMIMAGRVTVNGRVVRELGTRVDAERDVIAVDGQLIELPQPDDPRRYVIVHKPIDVISTAHDTHGRPTVVGLVPSDVRLFPVGRLDADSEGLLLLTDDGDLAYRLTHPRFEVEKEYRVLLDRAPSIEDLRRWREGVELEGEMTLPAWIEIVERTDDGTWVRVVMREGRKRQIREVAKLLGFTVKRLIRVREGPITLDDLPAGQWRELSADEVQQLRAHTQHIPTRAQDEERERRMAERDENGRRRPRILRGPRRSWEQRPAPTTDRAATSDRVEAAAESNAPFGDDRRRDTERAPRQEGGYRNDRAGDRGAQRTDDRRGPNDRRTTDDRGDRPYNKDRASGQQRSYGDRPRFDDRGSRSGPRTTQPRFGDRNARPSDRSDRSRPDDRGGRGYGNRSDQPRFNDRSDRPRSNERSGRPSYNDRSDRPRFDDRNRSDRPDRPRSFGPGRTGGGFNRDDRRDRPPRSSDQPRDRGGFSRPGSDDRRRAPSGQGGGRSFDPRGRGTGRGAPPRGGSFRDRPSGGDRGRGGFGGGSDRGGGFGGGGDRSRDSFGGPSTSREALRGGTGRSSGGDRSRGGYGRSSEGTTRGGGFGRGGGGGSDRGRGGFGGGPGGGNTRPGGGFGRSAGGTNRGRGGFSRGPTTGQRRSPSGSDRGPNTRERPPRRDDDE